MTAKAAHRVSLYLIGKSLASGDQHSSQGKQSHYNKTYHLRYYRRQHNFSVIWKNRSQH